MKKKYTRFLIIFVVLFQIFVPGISQVYAETNNASKQPAVCAGPSKTMQEYFDFQRDAIKALYSSNVVSPTISVGDGDGWLFTKRDLTLPSSALDYLVDNMWGRTSSMISTAATSVVLLLLASESVIQSDVEGFVIFFKDRPIVRDYKKMLDIESEIFELAFTFSKNIDLTRPADGNAVQNFNSVVKKYQASGLLRGEKNVNGSVTMSNILSDLISMNAHMKFFIAMGGEVGASELRSYAGCLGQNVTECDSSNFILGFNFDAVRKLEQEYSGTWGYGRCNSYVANLSNTYSKAKENGIELVRGAIDDIKISIENLKNALIGQGTWKKVLTDPCQMSDYERAQLDAYYGGDWTCGEGISLSSLYQPLKDYINEKKTIKSQREKGDDLIKKSSNSRAPSFLDVDGGLNELKTTKEKEVYWYRIFSGESTYNSEFSDVMNNEFYTVFEDIYEEFGNSKSAAMASDLSYELVKIKGLINQVDTAMIGADELRKHLQDIADYQCSM